MLIRPVSANFQILWLFCLQNFVNALLLYQIRSTFLFKGLIKSPFFTLFQVCMALGVCLAVPVSNIWRAKEANDPTVSLLYVQWRCWPTISGVCLAHFCSCASASSAGIGLLLSWLV